jgi:hypothetical protein
MLPDWAELGHKLVLATIFIVLDKGSWGLGRSKDKGSWRIRFTATSAARVQNSRLCYGNSSCEGLRMHENF